MRDNGLNYSGNPELFQFFGIADIANKILHLLGWHGVAMVEFKVGPDEIPYLMEVNARFWGSLQLAIDAGVDFPYLLFKMAIGAPLEHISEYKVGTKSRWLLGDLDHLYLRLRDRTCTHVALPSKWQTFRDFMKFFDPLTRYEINRWGDMKPFLLELRNYITQRSG